MICTAPTRQLLLGAILSAWGCAPSTGTTGGPSPPFDPAAFQSIEDEINRIALAERSRHHPLYFQKHQEFLAKFDQVVSHLSGRGEGKPPRLLPKLDAEDESAHFRETIRRWKARDGKDLRAELDAVKDKPMSGAEFHRRFDGFIAIQEEELSERRRRALHRETKAVLDTYRDKHPDLVRHFEGILNKPPHALPKEGSGPDQSDRGSKSDDK